MISRKLKTLTSVILLGLALAGFGMSAHAQKAKQAKSKPQKSRVVKAGEAQTWQARNEKKFAGLKDRLKLSEEQLPAWEEYMYGALAAKKKLRTKIDGKRVVWTNMTKEERAEDLAKKREQWLSLTAVERIEIKQTKIQNAADAMGELLAVTRTFYAQLSADQQKIFDDDARGARPAPVKKQPRARRKR